MLYFSRWKIFSITAALIIGLLFALPNVLPEKTRESLPSILPSETINLGLDLQGGAHLLLGVDLDDVRTRVLDNEVAGIKDALRAERIRYVNVKSDGEQITGKISDADRADEAFVIINALSKPVTQSIGAENTLDIERTSDTTFKVAMTEANIEDITQRTVTQSIDVLRRRIDPTGTTEMTLAPEGDDRILLQVPGAKNIDELKRKVYDTANMSFHLVRNSTESDLIDAVNSGRVPPGHTLINDEDGAPILIRTRAAVTGEDLKKATDGLHPERGSPIVNFEFNSKGTRAFARITSDYTGDRFAGVLDGVVISSPRMSVPIRGGSGFIEGRFSPQEARELSVRLNAGALPAKLIIEEERSVGATLGNDSIEAGKFAAVLGLAGVGVFMFIMYGFRFGTFANLALAFNIVLIAAALSLFGATLTLPGIAGIILTIGMAVDANVLIFERIREEYANGRPPMNAIDTGYRLSLAPILDANITTLIAALTLYFVGSGPIRGFAVTLAIGIVMSVFTAVVVARLFTAIWHKRARPKTLPI